MAASQTGAQVGEASSPKGSAAYKGVKLAVVPGACWCASRGRGSPNPARAEPGAEWCGGGAGVESSRERAVRSRSSIHHRG